MDSKIDLSFLEGNNILDRFKLATNCKNDTEISELLNIKRPTIGSWRSRGTVDYQVLIKYCYEKQIDLNFIFTGVPTERMHLFNQIDDLYHIFINLRNIYEKTNNKEFKDINYTSGTQLAIKAMFLSEASKKKFLEDYIKNIKEGISSLIELINKN